MRKKRKQTLYCVGYYGLAKFGMETEWHKNEPINHISFCILVFGINYKSDYGIDNGNIINNISIIVIGIMYHLNRK